MIAEPFSTYDATGRPVLRPSRRRYGNLGPNAPLGRLGRRDYWMPPEEFELRRRGDCEDFALWTWRQLMHLGYSARFVCGQSGRYGAGHAWVTFELEGRTFIVESLAARVGPTFPRLSTLRYRPSISASWDGRALKYFEHAASTKQLPFLDVAPHVPEWVAFWIRSFTAARDRAATR